MNINRLMVLIGACGVHLSIGTVYAWSVMTKPIVEMMGWSLTDVTITFSIAIFFLGMSAGFLGNYVQKWGAKKGVWVATGFFTSGLFVSALAIHLKSLFLLYLGYGVLGGIGLGVGYISPVATLLKWFPEKRGFAGGCAVMSFGFAAFISSPYMQRSIEAFGVEKTFIYLGLVYGIIMCISAMLIKPPPYDIETQNIDVYEIEGVSTAIHSRPFILLWVVFFINITCGIALLSIASPMGQNIGMTTAEAASMVGMLGLYNGAGRIICATISDYLGRAKTYFYFFIIETISFAALSFTTNIDIFMMLMVLIIGCYGGGFSCMPAFLVDLFGLKHLSVIHGRILTAWGFAGIAGPLLLTNVYELTGDYTHVMVFFSLLFMFSSLIAAILIGYTKNK